MSALAQGGRAGLIQPVILSGGVGTRLWPLSRALYPKQLLPLASDFTLLQETARRVTEPGRFAPPLVICNHEHRFIVAEQLREIGITPAAIVLEPVGRNTAPAAAVAALMLHERGHEGPLLLLPSDHVISNPAAFRAALDPAEAAARDGLLVTFGMAPTKVEPGYGHIQRGAPLDGVAGAYRAVRFVEKPDPERVRTMLDEGGWYWNSGMFFFAIDSYLEELEHLQPDILSSCRRAVAGGQVDLDFFRLGGDSFARAPSISVDYAVMEHTDRAAVVPVDMGWSDVGSWTSLWELGEKDAEGNVVVGEALIEDVRNCYLRSDGRLLAAIGIEDLLVVATADAVLVATKDRAQDVKTVVARIEAGGGNQHHAHLKVFRPWGSFQSLDAGKGYQVKHLTVSPGARLSLQKHGRRAEHWVVVQGTARVTRGDEVFDLEPNQSTYIPLGVKHCLENPGTVPLRVIEIQSGDYLGEDDIVRFDDVYGRSKDES